MKNSIKKRLIAIIAFVLLIASCSKDDSPEKKVVLSSDTQITSFVFLASSNNLFTKDIATIIDGETKTISTTLPSGTDLSALTPTVLISDKASVSPSGVQDFTNPVTYTVTAEDGTKVIYTVIVIKLLSQKEILQVIVDANPNNTLDWDLATTTESDLGTLGGVTTDLEGIIIALDLSSSDLTILPGEIGQLPNIKELDLSTNHLASLPVEVGLLTSLNGVYLNDNDLTTIPIEIGNLVNLNELGLSTNDLITIPVEIGNLVNLYELDFSDNNLITIPLEISNLVNLEWLDLTNNELTSIPVEIGNLVDLHELYLDNNQLTILPIEIGNLVNLVDLVLSNNKLTTIPSQIGKLVNLKRLYLYNNVTNIDGNKLTSLPIEIGELVHLEKLLLAGNKLTTIPAEIGFLTSLSNLDISSNELTSIPQAICNLETYKRFSIDKDENVSCEVASPKDALISIYSANPNNTLDWGVNSFSGVTFDSQRSIIELDLKDKGIQRITRSLRFLTFLELIDLRNNPLESVHAEVCALTFSSNLTILSDTGEGCN